MKREIKFRGLRPDGVWVYGMLGKTKETVSEDGQISYTGKYNYLIHSNEGHIGTWLVDGDTVSQFTGLHDKNGVEIYEGDIVECWDDSADDSDWGLDRRHTGVIEYASPSFSLAVKTMFPNSISRTASRHEIDGSYPNMKTYLDRWVNAENIEVAGNIHEKTSK